MKCSTLHFEMLEQGGRLKSCLTHNRMQFEKGEFGRLNIGSHVVRSRRTYAANLAVPSADPRDFS
jgi:hypothetical protein